MSLSAFQKGLLVGVVGGVVLAPWIRQIPGVSKLPTV
jgi:hypothetical protein